MSNSVPTLSLLCVVIGSWGCGESGTVRLVDRFADAELTRDDREDPKVLLRERGHTLRAVDVHGTEEFVAAQDRHAHH